ncbi:12-(S)-hydroxy-5,8,10,14-eicosatetraenoic acid receptor [Pangasianodon hypophthalmus]|uniref:12-(S)-hydroxy-5,8,10,14-eicosatetraenoic acid receptor n=1 Tax=Pangasianodon hypophthalmus TaxID=310915 RepID=UPI000F00815D|nr:12-(S)-hydroxy-5,8,10,14-eicosatetraenoic acid receptor [Pangasianodon hypophthalmus]
MAYHASDNCTAGSKDLYKFYFSVMILEFILALPLNLTVIYLFIFKLKFWKSKSNNIFLFNLVLADILLLICLPVRAYYFQRGERRSNNNTVCKSVLFMLFLNRGASIAFLTIISIDRYFSVVHPGIKNTLKIRKRSVLISVLVWVLLLPLTIPSMLTTFECCNSNETDEAPTDGIPENTTTDTFRELVFFTPVLIPSIVLVYCTIRITNRLKEKTVGDRTKLRRAVFLVTLVVLVFSFCFWPSAISRLVLLMVRVKELPRAEEIAVQVYDGLMCLSYLDCLLDPIVYCLSSTKFKRLYISTYLPFLMKGQHAEHH